MKKLAIITLTLALAFAFKSNAQDKTGSEKYGKTLNLGVGIGYYGYIGSAVPMGTLNYEFDVVRNFTLAPFVGIYSFQNHYYWGDPNKPYWDASYHQYSYRETAVPLGVKGSYYFDQLFHAGTKWDFYAAGSLGFVVKNVTWENGYYGDKNAYQSTSLLYLDAHVGAECHLTQKTGLFLDLSSGVSTFGLAFHF